MGHTPGPWHIGMKPGPIIYGPKGEEVADMRDQTLPCAESTANIHLILAAPELLEALTTLFCLAVKPDEFTEPERQQSLDNARAAIAKAKGA